MIMFKKKKTMKMQGTFLKVYNNLNSDCTFTFTIHYF